LTGHHAAVNTVAFGPDGRLVSGSGSGSDDGTARLWDTTTGQISAELSGHTGDVYPVQFSPDGSLLASGGVDRTIRVRDVATGRTRAMLAGHTDEVKTAASWPPATSTSGCGCGI
jgi:WD40 repeat protein